MQCLVASAKEFLKEDQLQKCRMVFEDDSKDKLQVSETMFAPESVIHIMAHRLRLRLQRRRVY